LFAGTVPAPITVGVGANAETVTPSSVSCSTPATYNTCTVTATFSNTHGAGEPVASGSFGLQEAANYQHALGGLVVIDGRWKAAGGVAATLTGNKAWNNVSVLDARGTQQAAAFSYFATGHADGGAWVASTVSWY